MTYLAKINNKIGKMAKLVQPIWKSKQKLLKLSEEERSFYINKRND